MNQSGALRVDDSGGSSAAARSLSRVSGSRLHVLSVEQELNRVDTNLDQEDQE